MFSKTSRVVVVSIHADPNLPSRTRKYFTRICLLGEEGEE